MRYDTFEGVAWVGLFESGKRLKVGDLAVIDSLGKVEVMEVTPKRVNGRTVRYESRLVVRRIKKATESKT
jgi:hypothetical protein